jgi:Uracil DNA glycosylase superfamily
VTPKSFVGTLADMRLPAVFNPYADCCDVHDRPNAAQLRRRNLRLFLEASIDEDVTEIWIARDLGYRGGRRTGVPLTDEVHLQLVGRLLGGIELRRATRGPVVAERTAAIVWRVLNRIDRPVLLWNVFPFHPHAPNDPFSNRCHTATERQQSLPLLQILIDMVEPERLVAIGRDAQLALKDIGLPVSTVRHPSYGGQSEFLSGLFSLYGIADDAEPQFVVTD